ncbi:hypothetical protein CK1_28390 [Ruminococcus sp. SR1/5]|nr:hypothetical protein CK1_28390 [Ruminococcus sp. SR1/5]
MLFGFGRVPGCLGLGLFFCGMAGSLSVLFFGGVREWWFAGRGLGNRGWFGYIVVFLCNI